MLIIIKYRYVNVVFCHELEIIKCVSLIYAFMTYCNAD